MTTDTPLEARLRAALAESLDGRSGPHTVWEESPAYRRSMLDRERHRRWPLRLLAIAALLVVGGAAGAAGAWLLRQSPPPNLPAVVADGWVAYSTGYDDGSDIVFVRAGVAPTRVIGTPDDGVGQSCPAFSPDGRSVAYLERILNGVSWTLAVAGLDDNGLPTPPPIRFTFSESFEDNNHRLGITTADFATGEGAAGCPRWSPDGTHLAVLTGSGVHVVDVSTGTTSLLPRPRGGSDSMALVKAISVFEWAPDSSRIVYTRNTGPMNETSELWVSTLTGEESLLLPAIPNERSHVLDWSGEGRLAMAGASSVVTETRNGDSSEGSLGFKSGFARVLDVAKGATAIDIDPRSDPATAFDGLAWSPDGRRVASIHDGAVTLMEPGSGSTQLPPMQILGQEVHPGCLNGWAPSGDRLLVVAYDQSYYDRGVRSTLLSIDAAGPSDPVVLRNWEPGVPWGICGVTSWQPTSR